MYTLQSDGSLHSGSRFKAEKLVMPMALPARASSDSRIKLVARALLLICVRTDVGPKTLDLLQTQRSIP
jgi:hypothetical protein